MRNIRFLLPTVPLFFGAAFGVFAVSPEAKPAKAAPVHKMVPEPNVAAGPFRDVPPNHWAAQAVERLRQAGIVHGYSGTVPQMSRARQRVRGR